MHLHLPHKNNNKISKAPPMILFKSDLGYVGCNVVDKSIEKKSMKKLCQGQIIVKKDE